MIQYLHRTTSLLTQPVCPTLCLGKTPLAKRIMKQELEVNAEKYKSNVEDGEKKGNS